MKILLISFYFPPAGGGGVQRTLKFAEHLAHEGFETHVLAPTDPRWIHRDEDQVVSPRVRVHRCGYIGPGGRRPADELYGLAGVRRLLRKISLLPRRLLLPDENALWTLTAIPAGFRIARRERFDVILTSSPPTSVHIVGATLKSALGTPWIADLRDSIVAKEDRKVEQGLTRLKERAHAAVARLVARRADAIVAVTPTIRAEIEQLRPDGPVRVIANGCDFSGGEDLHYHRGPRFRITHTGSFFGSRSPRAFLTAVAKGGHDITVCFVGDFRKADREWVEQLQLGDRLEIYPFLPHARALKLQRNSDVLLLLLPEVGSRGKDIPSGKLYEYITARRPILAAVPPDGTAAELISEANVGLVVHPDDVAGIEAALDTLVQRWKAGSLGDTELSEEMRTRFSRRERAHELAQLIRETCAHMAAELESDSPV